MSHLSSCLNTEARESIFLTDKTKAHQPALYLGTLLCAQHRGVHALRDRNVLTRVAARVEYREAYIVRALSLRLCVRAKTKRGV